MQQLQAYEASRPGFAESPEPEGATHINELIEQLLLNDKYWWHGPKSILYWPEDSSISDALSEACIQLGLSDEEFAPSTLDHAFEIEIFLV